MKYIDLFEAFEMKLAYPYKIRAEVGIPLNWIDYQFETKDGDMYEVGMSKAKSDRKYHFNFLANGNYDFTGTNDTFRVMNTVGKILIEILNRSDLEKIPIVIEGMPSPTASSENLRGNVYLKILKKNLHLISNQYEVKEIKYGFELIPK